MVRVPLGNAPILSPLVAGAAHHVGPAASSSSHFTFTTCLRPRWEDPGRGQRLLASYLLKYKGISLQEIAQFDARTKGVNHLQGWLRPSRVGPERYRLMLQLFVYHRCIATPFRQTPARKLGAPRTK